MNKQVHVCAQMRSVGKALLIIVLHLYMIRRDSWCSSTTPPMKCTDTTRVCTTFLAFRPGPAQTMDIVQSMFDVLPQDITVEEGNVGGGGQVFVKKNCSCSTRTHEYLTNTTFTVREKGSDGGSVRDIVVGAYGGLAVVPNTTRVARVGVVVSLQLLCGCSSGLWNYLMSYVMGEQDSVMTLASRFGVSMDSIESVNGLSGPENVTVGALYYIPLNQVPGAPYASDKNTANNAPAPAPLYYSLPAEEVNDKVHLPYGWILGGTGFALVLIVVAIVIWVSLRSSSSFAGTETKDDDGNNYHKFHILQKSLCCAPGRCTCCSPQDLKQTTGETNDNQTTIPKVIRTDVFEVEKPLVFTHEEVLLSTDGFSDSNLLGHGTYGSVYYGILRDQEVAIKRMTATKTKEFMAEMKVLCTVHHTNLVELIGYAASDDELFVIYEYAQKGSVRSHLHDPQNKGHTSLSWIMRVQIALDAARGLEYIHEHTKTHYVHRDINTSNILLDAAFRAKISDFGLAKLVGKTNEGEASVTRVVGTFGYLAPEYLSDGFATSKSDVYAFGVVLLEIISGRQAITHAKGAVSKNSDRRSLVSIMLPALRNTPDPTSMSRMKEYIDPNMMELCPHDCVFKLAMLAKQCLDDEPMLRPDMKQVVISLSQILLSSVEWEATLAGNSQVFSGLVQGR